jgi:YjjG family noncanonical pyrimidine nucleotidase
MAVSSSFRGFLLDGDNTIFDFDSAEGDALRAAVGRPAEGLLGAYRLINEALWKEVETGAITPQGLAVERFRRLASRLALDGDPRELSRRYLRELASRAPLLAGAAEALDRLSRRAVLGLVTNGIASVQRSRIAVAGIEVFFQGIFISEEVGISKPDPAIFHLAARELHVAPYEVLCVGDSPSSDIRGGNAAGMATCWVNPRGAAYPATEPAPDYVVGSLEELLALAPPLS